MVPVGRGVQHEYADMFDSFTCCVGSGMESHALHADGIYYESGDKLYVNLYAPSTAELDATGVKLDVETDFPEGESATIKLTVQSPKEFTLALRRPYWVGDGFAIKVNGAGRARKTEDRGPRADGRRTRDERAPEGPAHSLRSSERGTPATPSRVTLPKTLRLEPLPDNPQRVAILWGPLVLAGDLGPEREGRTRKRSAYRAADVAGLRRGRTACDRMAQARRRADPDAFRTDGVGRAIDGDRARDVNLVPFYRLHRRTYAHLLGPVHAGRSGSRRRPSTPPSRNASGSSRPPPWRTRSRAKCSRNATSTTRPARAPPSSESWDDRPPGDKLVLVRSAGRGRSPDGADRDVLTATNAAEAQAIFEILVDGQRVAEQNIERSSPARFFDVEYALADDLVKGKKKVTVRFQATAGNEIATRVWHPHDPGRRRTIDIKAALTL